MGSVATALVALALSFAVADKPRKSPKPAEVEVLEITASRIEGELKLDGRVRNSGERSISKLVLLFDFLAPGRQLITSQKGEIEEETLPPGGEATFRWKMRDHVRAVEFQIQAVDGNGRDLKVVKAGPYPIE